VEARSVVRCPGFHIFYTIGSQMAVSLSALRADRALLPRTFSGINFCYRLSKPQGHSADERISFFLNPGQPRTLLQLQLFGIPTIKLFLT
jgi:hypothetical protein